MTQSFKIRESVYLPDLNKEFPPTSPDDPDLRFPDHTWEFWASPSMPVFLALASPFTQHSNEGAANAEESAYLSAVSEIVLHTGQSKLDLSSPEKVRDVFSNEPDGALVSAIVSDYAAHLLNRRDKNKKKREELSRNGGISKSKGETASTSQTS